MTPVRLLVSEVLAVVVLLLSPRATFQFILEGSDTSYARFSRWNINTTLSFEFTTNQPDGLILYTDDGGKSDFFELKLVEGILRLRFNLLNQGTQLINIGHHLNDGLWHRVELASSYWNVLVTVDGFVSERRNVASTSAGGNSGRNSGGGGAASPGEYVPVVFDNTGVFIGGLPGYFNSKLGELTLPSVVFEPRFRGAVRNLVYGAWGGSGASVVKPQEIVESKGLISGSATSEACERHDPCLHGGFCISTDSGPVCDCKHIDFEGVNCEVEKSPTTATFHGREYIGYDFRESGGHQPIISQLDEISLYFKTSNKKTSLMLHTLLFYSGDGVDYIALTLRNGQLMLSINLGSGPLDTKLHPDHLRFDDGNWHSVRVHRKIQEITASVDGIHFDRWTLAGSFTLLSSNRVTVAGYDTLRPLNGIRGVTNFVGCLKKVEYRADTLRLNILELARSGNRLVTISGASGGSGPARLTFTCQDSIDAYETGVSGTSLAGFVVDEHDRQPPHNVPHHSVMSPSNPQQHHVHTTSMSDNPITFTTPENSYLTIPPYHNVSSHSTTITMKLRTTEPNGLLLYSAAASNLVALELVEGHVVLVLQSSNPHLRIQATSTKIHDGEWHTIKLIRNGRSGSVSVDDLSTDFNLRGESRSIYLGVVYLGNVPTTVHDERVWSVGLGVGFVGCMKNVMIEHTLVDLVRLANSQDIGGIRPYCHVGSAGECVSNPCLNNGKCTDGWGRFVCECKFVGFEGGVCQVDAPYLDLSDGNVLEFTNRSVSSGSRLSARLFVPTQAQDIKFRFKTGNSNAVLLSLSGGESDFIEVRVGGRLRVRVRIHDVEKTLSIAHPPSSSFNDNNWHVFMLQRRGAELRLYVDDLPPVSAVLGSRSAPTLTPVKYTLSSLTSPFTGQLQSLEINNVEFLQQVQLKRLKPVSAASYSVRTFKSITNPIQFLQRSKYGTKVPTYITLPQLKAYSDLGIRFKFKTQVANGVLFYNGASTGNEFVLVHIEDFKLVFEMALSDGSSVRVLSHRLKLDTWVDVHIDWDGGAYVVVSVDQYVYEEGFRNAGAGLDDDRLLRLNGVLYVGGGVGEAYSSKVPHDSVFVGCIGNVDLGGEGLQVEGGGVNGVVHGCGRDTDSPSGGLEPYNPMTSRCTTDTCDNGGRCVEEPDNSVSCDCEMTSYTGPTCSLESTSYEFSSYSSGGGGGASFGRPLSHSRPGVIQFTYQQNREPTTLQDTIAFGFVTGIPDAVLLRIESVKTTDYLEVELIAGKLRTTYNMYLNKDHTIGDPSRLLNDNAYHVLRFTREGSNATLQIDNSDIITTYPVNLKENLFNSIGIISVGGRIKELKREITIVRGFKGIVSGLVINGMHLLDMTLNGDPRIKVYGDVRKVSGVNSLMVGGGSAGQGGKGRGGHHRNQNGMRRIDNYYVYQSGDFQRAQPASSSSTTLSDDLISSGDHQQGGGHHRCMVTDDEDNEDCAGGSGSFTDDIITPVYIPTTRVTTTITTTKSNGDSSNMYFPCAEDDEDCVEYGSGTGTVYIDSRGEGRGGYSTTSNNMQTTTDGSSSSSSSGSSSSSSAHYESTSEHSLDPIYRITTTDDSQAPTHHHHHTHSSSYTPATTSTSTTTQPTTTTRFTPPTPPSKPPYYRPNGPLFDPIDSNPVTPATTTIATSIEKKKSYNETVYFADSGDSTLIIIIIIAVLMIIIVSILIIFFMCKRRDDPIYKIEAQQQQQQPTAPPIIPAPQSHMQAPPVGVVGTGAGVLSRPGAAQPGGPRKTGVKEWYV